MHWFTGHTEHLFQHWSVFRFVFPAHVLHFFVCYVIGFILIYPFREFELWVSLTLGLILLIILLSYQLSLTTDLNDHILSAASSLLFDSINPSYKSKKENIIYYTNGQSVTRVIG